MADITKTLMPAVMGPGTITAGGGMKAPLTVTTLGTADTLRFERGCGQYLFLRNPTGGSITVTLDGQDASNMYQVDGYGTRSLTAGYAITIAAGASYLVPLGTISGYLVGTVDVTSTGAGVQAALISYI